MIQLAGAAKHFGGRTLFQNVDLLVPDRARVGVVGANGSGKTTLLRILAGVEQLDEGKLVQNKDQTVGYLPQEGLRMAGRSLLDECRSVFAELMAVEGEIAALEAQLEHTDDLTRFERYAELQHQFQVGGGPALEARIGTILAGLAFTPEDLQRPCEDFSGGWQMRIALAKLLLAEPRVLLLDEPTNHLDLETRNWLEEYLGRYPHACLLVSHDRYFLDAVVDRIADVAQGKITVYTGNYTSFLRQKEDRLVQLRAAYNNQKERREQLEVFINRFRYTATKAAQVQSRIKELERMEAIEVPPAEETIHFSFPQPKPSGRRVLELRQASKRYGAKRVFEKLDLVLDRGDRIGLIGPNGAGKSTLLRLLAGVEPPDSGERVLGHQVTLDFFAQDQYKVLDESRRILDDLTAVSPALMVPQLRNLLGSFLFHGDDVFKRIGVLSGGERNRYALARMLLQPSNCLLLDEPTNHLDLQAKEVLLEALKQYNGTVIFVSHDRAFIDGLATKMVHVTPFEQGGGVEVYPGNYEEYRYHVDQQAAAPAAGAEKRAGAPAQPSGAAAAKGKRVNPQREQALKNSIAELERAIAEAEDEVREMEAALASQATFRDGERAQATLARYQSRSERRAQLYAEWEEKTAAMAALTGA
ncbi:MAG TPA: ABC-F family ATP-binding cassette domain-containing protein [Terriglobales bacterium]|nr:ABC-F family ATP-binding cassette domain-containing protein [Terriglobales bacterium]